MPNRYRLKGASLEEIRRKAEQLYGPAARIVSAERVISPGIAGLFAQDRYEAMIEILSKHEVVTGEVVPDADILAAAEPARRGGPQWSGRARRHGPAGERRREDGAGTAAATPAPAGSPGRRAGGPATAPARLARPITFRAPPSPHCWKRQTPLS